AAHVHQAGDRVLAQQRHEVLPRAGRMADRPQGVAVLHGPMVHRRPCCRRRVAAVVLPPSCCRRRDEAVLTARWLGCVQRRAARPPDPDPTMNQPSRGLARTAQILRFLLKYRGAGVFTGLDLEKAALAPGSEPPPTEGKPEQFVDDL